MWLERPQRRLVAKVFAFNKPMGNAMGIPIAELDELAKNSPHGGIVRIGSKRYAPSEDMNGSGVSALPDNVTSRFDNVQRDHTTSQEQIGLLLNFFLAIRQHIDDLFWKSDSRRPPGENDERRVADLSRGLLANTQRGFIDPKNGGAYDLVKYDQINRVCEELSESISSAMWEPPR